MKKCSLEEINPGEYFSIYNSIYMKLVKTYSLFSECNAICIKTDMSDMPTPYPTKITPGPVIRCDKDGVPIIEKFSFMELPANCWFQNDIVKSVFHKKVQGGVISFSEYTKDVCGLTKDGEFHDRKIYVIVDKPNWVTLD